MDHPAYSQFDNFIETYWLRLVNRADYWVRDRSVAEDLVTQLIITFRGRLERATPPSPPKYAAFANKMLFRICMKWLKLRNEEQKNIFLDHPKTEHDGSDVTDALGKRKAGAFILEMAQDRHLAEGMRLVEIALTELGSDARWFFVKRKLEGWTLEQIAEAKGINGSLSGKK